MATQSRGPTPVSPGLGVCLCAGKGGVKREVNLGSPKNLENPASVSFCLLKTWVVWGQMG